MRTALVISLLLASIATAIAGEPPTRPDPLVADDLMLLLEVGVPEDEILAIGDRVGWPRRLGHAQLERMVLLGAGPRLCERLLLVLGDQPDRRKLLAGWHPSGFDHGRDWRIALLAPGDLTASTLPDGSGLLFEEVAKGVLLEGRSLFVAAHPAAGWRPDNERALARLAFEAARDGLDARALRTGVAVEHTLMDPAGGGSFAMLDCIVEDPESGRRGLLAVAVRVLAPQGLVLVAGIAVPLGEDGPDPLNELGILLGSADPVARAL